MDISRNFANGFVFSLPKHLVDTLMSTDTPIDDVQKIVVTMLRLGIYPFVMKSTDGHWALSIGKLVSTDTGTSMVTMEFQRVTKLTSTEAALCKAVGAGSFTAPQLVERCDPASMPMLLPFSDSVRADDTKG